MKHNRERQTGTSITINIDVTKIVKYVSFAGIIIVGIIFGTKCFTKLNENGNCILTKFR